MSVIAVRCIDQSLTITNAPMIASGSVESDRARFEFCPLWDGLVKTAIFYRTENEVYSVLIDESNECSIPQEVLSDEGTFFFGVFGVKNNTVKTSEVLRYRIRKGAISEDTRTPDPTPDIYAQIISRMDSLGQIVTYITESEIDSILEV